MNEVVKVPDASASDKVKLTIAILLAFGGAVTYYALPVSAGAVRWLSVVGGLVLGLAIFAWSRYGGEFWQFVLDSRIELRKIVWPNRQETGMTTLVVFVFVTVAGLFFWVLDLLLAWATRALTGQGG
jgi:preprotein translocase subunit SecE